MSEGTIVLAIAITGLLVFVGGVFAFLTCEGDDTTCQVCQGSTAILGLGGIVGAVNPPAGIVIGIAGALVGVICAIGGFLDWEMPGLAPRIDS